MRQTLRAAFFLCGCVIGAGFASGRELISFFGAFGFYSVILAALCGVLFTGGFLLFIRIGRAARPRGADEMNAAIFGRAAPAADALVLSNYLIGAAAMLSASGALFGVTFGIPVKLPWFQAVTAALAFLCVFTGIKGLINLNAALMPALLAYLAVISLLSVFNGAEPRAAAPPADGGAAAGIWAAVTYAGMNFMQAFYIIGRAGASFGVKAARRGAFVAGALLSSLMAVMLSGIRAGGADAAASDMPALFLSGRLGPGALYACAAAVYLALFLSLLNSAFTLTQYLNGYLNSKPLSAFIVLSLGLTLGMLGFSNIVRIFFPLQGVLGVLYIACAVRYVIKTRAPASPSAPAISL